MNENIFQRHEIKYIVTDSQREAVVRDMSEMMEPDPHGESTVCNIYYDTPDYRLIRRSIEKPAYKEKFRVRSYGRCGSDSTVFMELKKKYDGVVYKRRISLPESVCTDYLAGMAPLPEDSQIVREIEYFRGFYKGLAPKVYLSYDREAFYERGNDSFRVTFDRNIRFRETGLSLTEEPGGRLILPEGFSLMEIKTSGAIPLWFVSIITRYRLTKANFSKYGTAFETILKEKLEKDGCFVRTDMKARTAAAKTEERGKQNDRYHIFGNNDSREPFAPDIPYKHVLRPDTGRGYSRGIRV